LQVDAEAQLPGDLLSATKLKVKVNDQQPTTIDQPGKGGTVSIAAGTRIERVLSFPAARFVGNADATSVATVVVEWEGLAGANCMFKVAPDTSKLDIEALDLAKTQVVLVTNYRRDAALVPSRQGTEPRQELREALQGRLLRRHEVPPRAPRLHDPGW
jgi:hypothetical protein